MCGTRTHAQEEGASRGGVHDAGPGEPAEGNSEWPLVYRMHLKTPEAPVPPPMFRALCPITKDPGSP